MFINIPFIIKQIILSKYLDFIYFYKNKELWRNEISKISLVSHEIFNIVSRLVKKCYLLDHQINKQISSKFKLIKYENITTLITNIPIISISQFLPKLELVIISFLEGNKPNNEKLLSYIENGVQDKNNIAKVIIESYSQVNTSSTLFKLCNYYQSNSYRVRERLLFRNIDILHHEGVYLLNSLVKLSPTSINFLALPRYHHYSYEDLLDTSNSLQSVSITYDFIEPYHFTSIVAGLKSLKSLRVMVNFHQIAMSFLENRVDWSGDEHKCYNRDTEPAYKTKLYKHWVRFLDQIAEHPSLSDLTIIDVDCKNPTHNFLSHQVETRAQLMAPLSQMLQKKSNLQSLFISKLGVGIYDDSLFKNTIQSIFINHNITTIKLLYPDLSAEVMDYIFDNYHLYKQIKSVQLFTQQHHQKILDFIDSIPKLESFYFSIPIEMADSLFDVLEKLYRYSIINNRIIPKLINVVGSKREFFSFQNHIKHNDYIPLEIIKFDL
ncbi:hypothetical protein PPL_02699 [Heterostelium album PN500]|uniref:Uncharacterized protein n=1 Tax=Heterostelium pallidum (strain ATCC 26659 / Pp 5 / PN500) TaxID=670386 RepID=D3B2T5_HETP5|nr:hypothetical protein PPL_02699 [Heterostelium album PN500]EFA83633.1 hypothetical protein PPL_02699 [Heterostelium album PN500]|eukprot:XP_020435750.1 hypothetical protein PPL_02699 [Heterostelium album PN500]